MNHELIDIRIKGKEFESGIQMRDFLNELGYEVTIVRKNPKASKNHKVVDFLPKEMREELDTKIVSRQFYSYQQLADWLTEHGYSITHSPLSRYGKQLQAQYDKMATAALYAKTLAANIKDEEGSLPEMIQAVMQSELLYNLIEQKYSTDGQTLIDLLRAGSSVINSSITVKKYRQQIQDKIEKTAKNIEETCKEEGSLTEDKIAWIKEQILGIVQ